MRILATILLVAASLEASATPSSAATFKDGESVELHPGDWNGTYGFLDVYCLTFPDADRARQRASAYFNGSAVALTQVVYDGPVLAYVVSSTLPEGRAADADMVLQRERAQQLKTTLEGVTGAPDYDYRLSGSGSRQVLEQHYTDVAQVAPGHDPFPLDVQFNQNAGDAPKTLAESRLFARDGSRIEVAAMTGTSGVTDPQALAQARRTVSQLADALLASIQHCTPSAARP